MLPDLFHQTVLQREAIEALNIKSDGTYIDATFGRGGHTKTILNLLGLDGKLIAIDRDPQAIIVANELQSTDSRLKVAYATFSQIRELKETTHLANSVDGILFDLGVSSPQLDDANRGFSFLRDGPLDMRMDPSAGMSAAEWINSAAESEIADTFYKFGDEKYSRRMAKRIIAKRAIAKISTTGQLAKIIKEANPAWEKDKHPATRAFQAIRILINKEFDELQKGLNDSLRLLKGGGRLVVISFHSLEDRIVKRFVADHVKGDDFPRDLPVTSGSLNPRLKKVGKPMKAGSREIQNNRRARSAIMRVAEKLS
jgi:16S rRNA (cytosine1402-N4)-methyltransferase